MFIDFFNIYPVIIRDMDRNLGWICGWHFQFQKIFQWTEIFISLSINFKCSSSSFERRTMVLFCRIWFLSLYILCWIERVKSAERERCSIWWPLNVFVVLWEQPKLLFSRLQKICRLMITSKLIKNLSRRDSPIFKFSQASASPIAVQTLEAVHEIRGHEIMHSGPLVTYLPPPPSPSST